MGYSNYPDGVSSFDIPGHRPEDVEIDKLWDYARKELGRVPTDAEQERILDAYWRWGWDEALNVTDRISEEQG